MVGIKFEIIMLITKLKQCNMFKLFLKISCDEDS